MSRASSHQDLVQEFPGRVEGGWRGIIRISGFFLSFLIDRTGVGNSKGNVSCHSGRGGEQDGGGQGRGRRREKREVGQDLRFLKQNGPSCSRQIKKNHRLGSRKKLILELSFGFSKLAPFALVWGLRFQSSLWEAGSGDSPFHRSPRRWSQWLHLRKRDSAEMPTMESLPSFRLRGILLHLPNLPN